MKSDVARARDSGDVASARRSARCVLIVDDDPLVQRRLQTLIARAGYYVTSVGSLQQARRAIASVFFPIIILDRVLDGDDGIDLCTEVRHLNQAGRAFVLILSVLDSTTEVAKGLRAGADAYLSKRCTDAELLAYVEAASHVAEVVVRPKRERGRPEEH